MFKTFFFFKIDEKLKTIVTGVNLHLNGFNPYRHEIRKERLEPSFSYLVPLTGIEPVRFLRRGILSFLFSVDFRGK
jgi:hypothetical protein